MPDPIGSNDILAFKVVLVMALGTLLAFILGMRRLDRLHKKGDINQYPNTKSALQSFLNYLEGLLEKVTMILKKIFIIFIRLSA